MAGQAASGSPVWSGPFSQYPDKTSVDPKLSGKSGTGPGPASVPSGGGSAFGGVFYSGSPASDGDADDMDNSAGNADDHADCVPDGGKWPANA